MKKGYIKTLCCILLLACTLPILNGCNNEDDLTKILTGKTWKLSRLTVKGSSEQFYRGIWNNDKDYENSLKALDAESNFTLVFTGVELNKETLGSYFNSKGINSTMKGDWNGDGKSNRLTFSNIKVMGGESDPLAREFNNGLQKVEKYEGDSRNLTLYYKDGQVTRIMGFVAK